MTELILITNFKIEMSMKILPFSTVIPRVSVCVVRKYLLNRKSVRFSVELLICNIIYVEQCGLKLSIHNLS